MEYVNCPLCKANDAIDFLSVFDWYNSNGGPFTFVRCSQCGLTYLNPRPNGTELMSYNQTMWERWSITEQSKETIGSPETAFQTYHEIIAEINRRKPEKGKLLDVGSGQGGFLKLCQRYGWDVYGIDISEECIAYVKSEHHIENAFVSDLLDAGFQDNEFDVVIFNHLIEHLTNPQEYLKEIQRILKPTGILCISTPNIDSLSAKVFGKYWQALFVPLHLILFSPNTLARMLEATSFSVNKVSHFSHFTNAYILLRSISGVVGIVFEKVKGGKSKEDQVERTVPRSSIRESRAKVLFRKFRKVLYSSVSPIIIFEGIVQRGASITVYATPHKDINNSD